MNNLNVSLKKSDLSALLFVVVAMISVSAYAVPTSLFKNTPGDLNEWSTNGVLWTLTGDATPGVDSSGSFTLTADVTGWDLGITAYLAEFSLKNFGADATLSNLVAPGAATWSVLNAGLNSKGCKNNKTVGDALCVYYNDTQALVDPSTSTDSSISGSDTFSFTFDLDLIGGLMPDFTHLKVRWVDAKGKNVGDLISQDITWVPEPGMLGLLAIGLLGMVVTRRRMKV